MVEDRRDEQQRHADQRRVIPESTDRILTEERYQEQFGAGLAALSCTATRVPTNPDRAILNLMRDCDGSLCEKTVFAKYQVIEVVHVQQGMAMITSSWCRT